MMPGLGLSNFFLVPQELPPLKPTKWVDGNVRTATGPSSVVLVLSHANVFKTVISDCFKHSNFFKVNDLELLFRPPFEYFLGLLIIFGPIGSAFNNSPTFPKMIKIVTTHSVKNSGECPEL